MKRYPYAATTEPVIGRPVIPARRTHLSRNSFPLQGKAGAFRRVSAADARHGLTPKQISGWCSRHVSTPDSAASSLEYWRDVAGHLWAALMAADVPDYQTSSVHGRAVSLRSVVQMSEDHVDVAAASPKRPDSFQIVLHFPEALGGTVGSA